MNEMAVKFRDKFTISDLSDNVIMTDIQYYKKNEELVVFCYSEDYLSMESIKRMKQCLRDAFQIKKVKIKMKYKESKSFVVKNIQTIFADCVLMIQKNRPNFKHWSLYIKIEYANQRFYIMTANEFAKKFIQEHKIVREIEENIKKISGTSVHVELFESENKEQDNTEEYIKRKKEESANLITEVITAQQVKSPPKERPKKSGYTKTSNQHRGDAIYGREFNISDAVKISEINEDIGTVVFKGCVFQLESREIQNGKRHVLSIFATDYSTSISIKIICKAEDGTELLSKLKTNDWYYFKGSLSYDTYQRENIFRVNAIKKASSVHRMDKSEQKRTELHLHTKLSAMDAVASVDELVERAASWGHSSVAITDHGNIQAFPTAHFAGKKNGIKIIYGVEAYLVNDCISIVQGIGEQKEFNTFIAFDIETTGLNRRSDKIISIGAIKFVNGQVEEKFYALVNPECEISALITELTNITNEAVQSAQTIEPVLRNFRDFCKGMPLIAHNANFDWSFIQRDADVFNLPFTNPVIDTLLFAKHALPKLRKYKLNILCDKLDIQLENHHNAYDDALAAGLLFYKLLEIVKVNAEHLINLNQLNTIFSEEKPISEYKTYHAIILVKNYTGLKNLYRLISESHMNYFYRKPRMPKSLIQQYREGLVLGSACEAGELYRALVKGTDYSKIIEIANFYDYLEIQPVANNFYMVRNQTLKDIKHIQRLNKRVVELGEKLNKPVVATGDVHFLDPHDENYRRVLMGAQGFKDADNQPPLYFKTTDEMLEEFSYLGKEKAHEVVIDAPKRISESTETIQPVPDGLFPPEIEGSEDDIRNMSINTAKALYGEDLPEIVKKRLDKELNSIISNGYAVLYLIAQKLVKKSNDDGYLVGSRGSVGSSFVATMCGITEVNPLKPHYVCPKCQFSDFEVDDEKYGCGADLPDRECPNCGTQLNKTGFNIPFEVFLGFKGDKVPDIDLNFSGDYQNKAHKYTEVLLGKGYVFKAGTISTVASKTAYGFAKKYYDEKDEVVNNAELSRMVNGITGVKRSTGQHPGGLMVVPKSKNIYEFTPIQYPANAADSGVITTHFEYTYIHDNLVKLDILGHDDPTVIRMLEDITGIDAKKIPLDEQKTMSLFTSTEALNVSPKRINSEVGTMGLPEFGTAFVRQMLVDTKPTTFAELIRISGLSHGTDVWLNNAKDLVQASTATLREVICTRDDIMIYLMHRKMEPSVAFKIMESVRKGRGLTDDNVTYMKECQVPDWYIESCKKIKYMFPRAHAAAYVIMAFRIAYFKVYYPEAFYATYFTVRADEFDYEIMTKSEEELKQEIAKLSQSNGKLTAREKNMQTIIEMVIEMLARGYKFAGIDLYESDAQKFIITKEGIRPPLSAIQGVGINAAEKIVEARNEKRFISIEDLRNRAKVSKTIIEVFKEQKIIDGLQESNQVSFF